MTSARVARRLNWKHWLFIGLPVLLVAFFVIRAWTTSPPLPATSTVMRGDLESSVLASGVMKPENLVAVGAQVTGRILSLNVKPGQHVKKGDVVALIDSTNQQNELRKFRITLRQSEANRDIRLAELELTKQELARNQLLISKHAVKKSDYETAVNKVKQQEAQLVASEAAIEAARIDVKISETNLGYTRITAPIDGTVLMTVVQEGQTVNARQSAPIIAVLGQLTAMVVEVDISEADITKVKEGQRLYFTIAGQNAERYQSVLQKIIPAPDTIINDRSFTPSSDASNATSGRVAVYYKGIFTVANPQGFLKTYMTANVHILLADVKNILTVPVSALKLTNESNKATVLVVGKNGGTSERSVETGISDKINVEIKSGLNEGDVIVTDNQMIVSSDNEADS